MMASTLMIRTQIQFSETQIQALKSRAAREHASVSELVRQAVDAWVAAENLAAPDERRRRAIEASGRFASGLHDVAAHHDKYLADAYRK